MLFGETALEGVHLQVGSSFPGRGQRGTGPGLQWGFLPAAWRAAVEAGACWERAGGQQGRKGRVLGAERPEGPQLSLWRHQKVVAVLWKEEP